MDTYTMQDVTINPSWKFRVGIGKGTFIFYGTFGIFELPPAMDDMESQILVQVLLDI